MFDMGHDTGASSEPNTQSHLVPQNSKYKMKENYMIRNFLFSGLLFDVPTVIFP
jgi:hypothetical protein